MSNFSEFYCISGGSNLNAGSDSGTTASYTCTNGSWDGTSTYTPADGSTPANSVTVGQFLSVYGAVSVTGFIARVTSIAAGVNGAITVSTTARSGTVPGAGSANCKAGGGWAGPSGATAFPFGFITGAAQDSNNDTARVNFVGISPSISAAMTHSQTGPVVFQGCTSTPGDGGKCTISSSVTASFTALTISGGNNTLRDFVFNLTSFTSGSSNGVSIGLGLMERVAVIGCRGSNSIVTGVGSVLVECEASTNGGTGANASINVANSATAVRCIIRGTGGSATSDGYIVGSALLVDCIADSAGRNGFRVQSAQGAHLLGCVASNCGASGVEDTTTGSVLVVENCILANNGVNGVKNSSTSGTTQAQVRLVNCFFWSNASGDTNGPVDASGSVDLTANPFNGPTTGDFSLNNTAGGGALVRFAGRGNFTQVSGDGYTSTTTGHPDGGAAQTQVTAGGGAPVIGSPIVRGLGRVA